MQHGIEMNIKTTNQRKRLTLGKLDIEVNRVKIYKYLETWAVKTRIEIAKSIFMVFLDMYHRIYLDT